MRVIVDTNVILDVILSREPFHTSAQKLMILSAEKKIQAFLTANSITDIYYFTAKFLKNPTEARRVLKVLFATFGIISVGSDDLNRAIEIEMEDYEDALVVACSKKNKSKCIISRDIKDFGTSSVPVMAPDDFIENYFPDTILPTEVN